MPSSLSVVCMYSYASRRNQTIEVFATRQQTTIVRLITTEIRAYMRLSAKWMHRAVPRPCVPMRMHKVKLCVRVMLSLKFLPAVLFFKGWANSSMNRAIWRQRPGAKTPLSKSARS